MRPIINVPEEDRVTDAVNMHEKFGKDRACSSGDILADIQTDRHTDRHTHHNTSQPAVAGEVKICRARTVKSL